MRVFCFVT
jgi:hypothetical protein